MLNRPGPRFADVTDPDSPWQTDSLPNRRMIFAAVLLTLPFLTVGIRLIDLQSEREHLLLPAGVPVRTETEIIPARNGRILSSDGQVLAEDVETFSLLLHYRQIEQPPNSRWLRGEALRRVGAESRRDRQAVSEAEQQVLAERERLWRSLAAMSGQTDQQFRSRLQAIQSRVEEIKQRVEQRRKLIENLEAGQQAGEGWQRLWWSVARALTTPPRRETDAPLIVAEELAYHAVAENLSLAAVAAIETNPKQFPGVRTQLASRRHYPNGELAAHVIGYRFAERPADADSAAAATVAQTGLERAYDRYLRGQPGLRRLWFDSAGQLLRSEVVRDAYVGRDLTLHLDAALQRNLEQILDRTLEGLEKSADAAVRPLGAGGAVVAVDVRSGAILAAASSPRYSLQQASERDPDFWHRVTGQPNRPLFDRVSQMAIPPGSVFKIATAIAGMESHKLDPDTPFDCRGFLHRPDRHRDFLYRHAGIGHGPITLSRALAESCNVYFFDLGERLGVQPQAEWATLLGFGRKTGIDLPQEASGNVSDPQRPDAIGMAVGQGSVTATPLQVARLMAAVANGRRLVTPHFARATGISVREAETRRPVLADESLPLKYSATLQRIREGLNRAVADPAGTAYKSARHPSVAIAGKTGTAEVGGDLPDHAWFAGYLPADDPQIAIVVALEHGGSGGSVAGPVARATAQALLDRGYLPGRPPAGPEEPKPLARVFAHP